MDFHPELVSKIKEAGVITIFGHAAPDGDCYGSQIGLRELIKENFPHKKVYAIGSGYKPVMDYLVHMDEVDEKTIASSLAILVDVSCLRRVEDPRVYKAKSWIKIDHHCINLDLEPFSWDCWVDEERIAAAEMVAELAFENHWKINKLAANALFLGMMTDSGRFHFFGTTEKTLAYADALSKLGADKDKLIDLVYAEDDVTKAYKNWMRKAAQKLGSVTYLVVSREDYQSRGLPYEKASEFVNALADVATQSHTYALFCQDEYGHYRVELRSNKRYPVQPTAKKFKGGGHRYAAGLELRHDGVNILDVLYDLDKVEPDV